MSHELYISVHHLRDVAVLCTEQHLFGDVSKLFSSVNGSRCHHTNVSTQSLAREDNLRTSRGTSQKMVAVAGMTTQKYRGTDLNEY